MTKPTDAQIAQAIHRHGSPTIGQGDVHGGVPGVTIYDDHMHFVIADLRRLFSESAYD